MLTRPVLLLLAGLSGFDTVAVAAHAQDPERSSTPARSIDSTELVALIDSAMTRGMRP